MKILIKSLLISIGILVFFYLFLFWLPTIVTDMDEENTLNRANESFSNGDYENSLNEYETLMKYSFWRRNIGICGSGLSYLKQGNDEKGKQFISNCYYESTGKDKKLEDWVYLPEVKKEFKRLFRSEYLELNLAMGERALKNGDYEIGLDHFMKVLEEEQSESVANMPYCGAAICLKQLGKANDEAKLMDSCNVNLEEVINWKFFEKYKEVVLSGNLSK